MPDSQAPPPGSYTSIVGGVVLDEDGAPAENAVVVATSLDESVPYSATVKTDETGGWVISNVPPGGRLGYRATFRGRASAVVVYLAEHAPAGCPEVRHRLTLRLEGAFPPPSLPPQP